MLNNLRVSELVLFIPAARKRQTHSSLVRLVVLASVGHANILWGCGC